MLADYHMHTNFSNDSEYPMEEAVKKSILIGLDEICFTEHIDYGVKTDLNCDCESYKKEFLRCKNKFGNRISMKFGSEFGMQTHTIPKFKETFDKYDFDFVILSCHQVDNQEFWKYEFQSGKNQEEYNRRYYEEILKVMQRYNNFSVLGHLDMIKRYDPEGEYSFGNVKDIVTEILKTVIAKGKGIEVNTSCYRYGLKDLTPSHEILKLYHELGGKLITIGSDAHKEEHMGCKIAETQKELMQLGFINICTYEKMKPVFHKL